MIRSIRVIRVLFFWGEEIKHGSDGRDGMDGFSRGAPHSHEEQRRPLCRLSIRLLLEKIGLAARVPLGGPGRRHGVQVGKRPK